MAPYFLYRVLTVCLFDLNRASGTCSKEDSRWITRSRQVFEYHYSMLVLARWSRLSQTIMFVRSFSDRGLWHTVISLFYLLQMLLLLNLIRRRSLPLSKHGKTVRKVKWLTSEWCLLFSPYCPSLCLFFNVLSILYHNLRKLRNWWNSLISICTELINSCLL